MDLKTAIETRTSVRTFTTEAVKIEDIKEMVRRAGLAPTVNNYQPWKFIAVTNAELLNKMAFEVSRKISNIPGNNKSASDNIKSQVEWFATFFKDAPAIIALSMESYETVLEKGVSLTHDEINEQRNHPDIQSAGAAIQNILLTAVDLGYVACWMSGPLIAKQELETMLQIENPFQLIAFVAIGKPSKEVKPRNKKSLEEIFQLID